MTYDELQPLVVFLALFAGAALGQFWRARWIRRNQARLRREAKRILSDAERAGKGTIIDAELRAKEILLGERRSFDSQIMRMREDLLERERLINQRLEGGLDLQEELESRAKKLGELEKNLESRENKLKIAESALSRNLEEICGMNQDAAQALLLEQAADVTRELAQLESARILEEAKQKAEDKARELIGTVLQRLARDFGVERSVSLVPVEGEALRGRIIGRDGRNIRAFEAITGVEIVLDEIPNHALLSCHDPERRENARVALVSLIEDGRIQPARIEEFVRKAQEQSEERMLEEGSRAAALVGLKILSVEVLSALGKLKLRSSLGQNVLSHSIETAQIAELVSAEMGMPAEHAHLLKRAALLHDIGKALNHNYQGPHALVGAEFLRKNGEDNLLCHLVAAHHQELPDQSYLCAFLRACDALSGARPGARREDQQAYVRRLSELEELACSFAGVEKAYALQAGRELHVSVNSQSVSDQMLPQLAVQIALKIEANFRNLGQVKVTVFRESRASGIAEWRAQQ